MAAIPQVKRPKREVTGADALTKLFDDLSVGDDFVSRGRTITEADVVNFAALTGDYHPLHTDAEYAADGMFGERVAHGMLCLSYALGLVNLGDTVIALRRLRNVTFKAPARLGDTIHVEGRVAVLRAYTEDMGMVTGRWKIVNQDGTTLVTLEIDSLWRRGNAHGGDD